MTVFKIQSCTKLTTYYFILFNEMSVRNVYYLLFLFWLPTYMYFSYFCKDIKGCVSYLLTFILVTYFTGFYALPLLPDLLYLYNLWFKQVHHKVNIECWRVLNWVRNTLLFENKVLKVHWVRQMFLLFVLNCYSVLNDSCTTFKHMS